MSERRVSTTASEMKKTANVDEHVDWTGAPDELDQAQEEVRYQART